MSLKKAVSKAVNCLRVGFVSLTLIQFSFGGPLAAPLRVQEGHGTQSPIKHVIVIVGENRTFDHIFATYEPKEGESVDNLLSKHIIHRDGSPARNYSLAHQFSADATDSPLFQLAPKNKTLFGVLPAPLNGGPSDVCVNNFSVASGACTLDQATSSENGLPADYYQFMLTGGSGLKGRVPDSRITRVSSSAPYSTLPPGPFQLTNSKGANTFPYNSYAASPVHRFYQMWQQFDCDASHISERHPNGCLADLFTWTEVSAGSNNNGKPQPANFSLDYGPSASTTGEGATAIYNMQQGDTPYTKFLADHYAMSDNYHQPVMGGTGFDEIMLFFGDALWFSDGNGNPAMPPHNAMVPGFGGPVDEIENPNSQPGTNNFWIQDGYGGFGNSGASTGVYQLNYGTVGANSDQYCNICNGFQYQTQIMTNDDVRTKHLVDTTDLYSDIANGTLPAVSFVKPSGWVDGHPASSKWDLFEGFAKKIVDAVQANQELWKSTAIMITTDEGGGYYDSGYTQILDFFGDGTRIPMIVVSPYTRPGHISHQYADHVSVLKFIERNWNLPTISGRSRDNLPNPRVAEDNPYVPLNTPAIGDLFDLFDFSSSGSDDRGGR